MNSGMIDDLIVRHLNEATGFVADCKVSQLERGQCTERNFFILRVDIAGSTQLLRKLGTTACARIAHAYLSAIDSITGQFGADRTQTRYLEDSVLAFFSEDGNEAKQVAAAAVYIHYAVHRLSQEAGLPLTPKVALQFAPLVVGRLGPCADASCITLGLPTHDAGQHSSASKNGAIWVSAAMANRLEEKWRHGFLTLASVESLRVNTASAAAALASAKAALASAKKEMSGREAMPPSRADEQSARLADMLYGKPTEPPIGSSLFDSLDEPDQTAVSNILDGYSVNLFAAYQAMHLPLRVLGVNI